MGNRLNELWLSYTGILKRAVLRNEEPLSSNSIQYWKNHIFYIVAIFTISICLIAIFPGVFLAVLLNHFEYIFYQSLVTVTLLILLLAKGITISVKKINLVTCIYLLCFFLIDTNGFWGPGVIILLLLPIISSIIISSSAAYLSVLVNLSICFIIGMQLFNKPEGDVILGTYSLHKWITFTASLILVNTFSVIAMQMLIRVFERMLNERTLAEQKLQESNERFEYVHRATFDAIWDWNLETKDIFRGQGFKESFGYNAEQVATHSDDIGNYIHPDDRGRVLKSLQYVLYSKENNWMAEYRFRKSDGAFAFVRDKALVVRDGQGKATRMIGALQDITERKRIYDQLVEKHNELKSLSSYLQKVRETERKKIAREVHDELGQLASAISIDIDWLNGKLTDKDEKAKNRIAHAKRTIEVLITTIRKIASSLRPSILDDFGLHAALEWHCNEFQQLNNISCSLHRGFDDREINIEIQTELFRIAQESLTNVMRHAEASQVVIRTEADDINYSICIKDNGKGFDVTKRKNTLGLIGIRERAVSINGELKIDSQIGRGTIIQVTIPKNIANENFTGR